MIKQQGKGGKSSSVCVWVDVVYSCRKDKRAGMDDNCISQVECLNTWHGTGKRTGESLAGSAGMWVKVQRI